MSKKKKGKEEVKKKPTLMEAIANSATFLVVANEKYLHKLRDRNSEISIQARLAKKFNKPVILVMTDSMSQSEKADLERYFVGYNVIKVIELILKNKDSWNSAASEISKIIEKIKKNTVLKRSDFIKIYLDKEHYYYSFKSGPVEICLEPCAGGFCVAAYNENKTMLESRKCTDCDGYLESYQAIFGERKDDAWTKALVMANDLYKRHVVISTQVITGEDVREGENANGSK